MSRNHSKIVLKFLAAVAVSVLAFAPAEAFSPSGVDRVDSHILRVKAKCSAGTVESYEGTDMSDITPKCEAIFNACVDEKLPCNDRLKKCKQFDKMDTDGSCYKKKR